MYRKQRRRPPSSRLNFIFFNRGQSFARSPQQLANGAHQRRRLAPRAPRRIAELAERRIGAAGPMCCCCAVRSSRPRRVGLPRHHRRRAAAHRSAAPRLHRCQRIDDERDQAQPRGRAAGRRRESSRWPGIGAEAAVADHPRRPRRIGPLLAAIGLALWSVNAEGRFRDAQRAAAEAQANSIDAEIAGEAKRANITGQLVAYATAKSDIRLGCRARTLFTQSATKHLVDPNTSLLDGFMRAQEEMRGNRGAAACSRPASMATSISAAPPRRASSRRWWSPPAAPTTTTAMPMHGRPCCAGPASMCIAAQSDQGAVRRWPCRFPRAGAVRKSTFEGQARITPSQRREPRPHRPRGQYALFLRLRRPGGDRRTGRTGSAFPTAPLPVSKPRHARVDAVAAAFAGAGRGLGAGDRRALHARYRRRHAPPKLLIRNGFPDDSRNRNGFAEESPGAATEEPRLLGWAQKCPSISRSCLLGTCAVTALQGAIMLALWTPPSRRAAGCPGAP